MMFSKFIWFWQAKQYRKTGHIIIQDSSCALFRRRADKFIPISTEPGAIAWIECGYFPTRTLWA